MKITNFRSRFGFHNTPFTREIAVKDRFPMADFDETADAVLRTLEARMSCAIIAPAGTGKTSILRAVVERLPAARYSTHYVKVTGLSKRDMCRYITYAAVPMMWLAFIFAAWFVATFPLPWHGVLAVILTTGGIGGFCINIGHELGHKVPHIERWLAKLVLAPTGYGHFTVEHNRGHHIEVATPEDSASSRMGESIYKFMLREVPGAWTRAWALETRRLSSLGLPAWSLKNEVIQPLLMTAVLWIALCLWLGFAVLPFILAASLWSNFQLTSANYIEHYGLLRAKDAKGNYEPCQPHHSWNSNHVFSNWAVFHLQRHSDHHAHPARRYQSLRHFEHLPELPNGYFGMFSAAYIPALWFRLMDQRLVDFVGGNARKINFDARQRERLIEKFKLTVA